MKIILSGEGPTDIGVNDISPNGKIFKPGAMYHIIDKLLVETLGYSIYENYIQYNLLESITYVNEQEISTSAKLLKSIRLAGNKNHQETAYFYKTSRAFAQIVKKIGGMDLAILFHDSDGTRSSPRRLWELKLQSMSDGFKTEDFNIGVPMIPKPKSEAWLLCALKNNYVNCDELEGESGNDNSPNSLKMQLSTIVGNDHQTICDKILNNEINVTQINMNSFNVFKTRLLEVMRITSNSN